MLGRPATTDPLARALVAGLPEERAAGVSGEALDALCAAFREETRHTWPGLAVDDAALGAFLAGKVTDDGDVVQGLSRLRLPDLALAWACSRGDARSLSALEPVLAAELAHAAARLRAPAAAADEALQIVRTILLVAEGERTPAIASYAGRGDLRAWVRVVAIRELVRVLKAVRKDAEFEDDALYDFLSPAEAPELEHLRALYRPDLVAAFRDAIKSLTSKERLLLRQQCLDGLSIDDLGALHGVHRATAARWLAKSRETLLRQTKRGLMKRLGISLAEVDSILRLLQSRLDLSLEHALATRTTLSPLPPKG
jgi:RNA polymerase sigma-70 factor (ECF subfamily)